MPFTEVNHASAGRRRFADRRDDRIRVAPGLARCRKLGCGDTDFHEGGV